MADPHKPRLLIIGVGNPYRSDDAAGLLAARQLKDAGFASAQVVEHSGEGTSLMESWKGADAVILIDAVSSGRIPGAIYRMDPVNKPLPAQMFQTSTHAFSLFQAIEMARALNQLPPHLIVFGIEGHTFQAGTQQSQAVDEALPELVRRVLKEAARMKARI